MEDRVSVLRDSLLVQRWWCHRSGVNVPGNALSGGFDFSATFPRYINIRRGAYLSALLSMACNPWRLVNTATTFIAVPGSYSVFLGPMTGLMISSYFVVNKRKFKVGDLFVGSRVYTGTLGRSTGELLPPGYVGLLPRCPDLLLQCSLQSLSRSDPCICIISASLWGLQSARHCTAFFLSSSRLGTKAVCAQQL